MIICNVCGKNCPNRFTIQCTEGVSRVTCLDCQEESATVWGWQCPSCGRCYAPHVPSCAAVGCGVQITTTTGTIALRMPPDLRSTVTLEQELSPTQDMKTMKALAKKEIERQQQVYDLETATAADEALTSYHEDLVRAAREAEEMIERLKKAEATLAMGNKLNCVRNAERELHEYREKLRAGVERVLETHGKMKEDRKE